MPNPTSARFGTAGTAAMTFGTFCSGIGAPERAWTGLGWNAQFVSEIEPFPCAVLAHHHPTVPNLGNMELIADETLDRFNPDVVCAGTPCQSFSVAGLRKGMADPRGNLALVFLRLVDRLRPRWLVWENVPGVLSSADGRDFGSFLGALGQLGYGWAYRVLDAQFFGVPQRRRRVFVVGCLGDWRGAAAVLFERHCLSGHPAPSREARSGVAASLTRGADSSGKGGYAGRRREDDTNIIGCLDRHMGSGGPDDNAAQANHLIAHCSHVSRALTACKTATGRLDPNEMEFVAQSLRAAGFDASEDGAGRGTPLVPVTFNHQSGGSKMQFSPLEDKANSLQRCQGQAIAYGIHSDAIDRTGEGAAGDAAERAGLGISANVSPCLNAKRPNAVAQPTYFSARISRNSHTSNQVGIKDDGLSDALSTDGPGAVAIPILEVGKGTTSRGAGPNGCGIGASGDPMFTLQAGAQHAIAFDEAQITSNVNRTPAEPGLPASTLSKQSRMHVAFKESQSGCRTGDVHATLDANKGSRRVEGVMNGMAVRRLTPRECERLQGFPDNYTAIPFRGKPAADGPRYRALGNSMAVPVLSWIGQRIAAVDAVMRERGAA